MRTFPVDIQVKLTNIVSETTIPFQVKVEAATRPDARALAKAEMLDYLRERQEVTKKEFQYEITKITIQQDPHITRSDRKTPKPIQDQPAVLGIPT